MNIICISVHFLRDSLKETPKINGYSFCAGVGRNILKKGGIVFFCENSLYKYTKEILFVKDYFEEQVFEACAFQISCYNQVMIIISLYRSPLSDLDRFFQELDTVLSKICDPRKNVILLGDLNIDFFSKTLKLKELLYVLNSYGIQNHINDYTRIINISASSIDYICSNFSTDELINCTIYHNGLSDHSAQIAEFSICKPVIPEIMSSRSLSKENYETFLYYNIYVEKIGQNCIKVRQQMKVLIFLLK